MKRRSFARLMRKKAMETAAIPGSLEFGGKRAILRIVFVNEDLLVGRRFWRPGRIGIAVWAKFGDRGVPGRTGSLPSRPGLLLELWRHKDVSCF